MPPTTRPPKPIESFGPEILQALIDGSKRPITLELPFRKAVFYRQRMNALRAEMRRQNHDLYRAVAQTTIRITWGEEAGFTAVPEKKSSTNVRFPVNKSTPSKLLIEPADSELGEALKKAGVTVPTLTHDKPEPQRKEAPAANTIESDPLTEFLRGEPYETSNKIE